MKALEVQGGAEIMAAIASGSGFELRLLYAGEQKSNAFRRIEDKPVRRPAPLGRPREAPGLSAGGLQVARRQVTLKPPPPGSR